MTIKKLISHPVQVFKSGMCESIQGVSGGIVNILGGGSMDYSE